MVVGGTSAGRECDAWSQVGTCCTVDGVVVVVCWPSVTHDECLLTLIQFAISVRNPRT